MFFAGCAISFVGVASAFKSDSMTRKVHMNGATTAAVVLSQLSLIFEFKLWLLSLISILICGTIALLGKKKILFDRVYIYWAEFVMIEIVFIALILKVV